MVATAQLFSEAHPGVEIIWDKRSLQEFADAPLDGLVERYDLLVIDHPWAGHVAARGLLLPLEEHLDAGFLEEQRAHQVGVSHDSYAIAGHQTALAIDAATPVASWRPDLLPVPPATWEEVLALARTGRVLMAAIPIDALMNFFMLCATLGEEPCQTRDHVVSRTTGRAALELLRELAQLCPPRIFAMNPIAVYREMSGAETACYCPFAYGYYNYARNGYAPRPLAFGDLASLRGQPMRSTLGGTGLAISARSPHRALALAYAQLVASPEIQRTVYTTSGGQPAHRLAWLDDANDRLTHGAFRRTLPALDRAYLRPRYNGYLHFQDRGGDPVRDFLMHGGDAENVLRELDRLYAESLAAP
jgi:multiple sugar transport system substrate-binding protein